MGILQTSNMERMQMTPSEINARFALARLTGEIQWLQNRVVEGRDTVKRLIVCLVVVSLALVAMIVWRAFGGCP